MKHAPISFIFMVSVFVYVAWIVLATSPTARIERGCEPINWTGSLSVSLVAFLNPTWEQSTQHFFDRTDYVCRYSVWRLIYGKQWQQAHPAQKPAAAPNNTIKPEKGPL